MDFKWFIIFGMNDVRIVSRKHANKDFLSVGLALILNALIVLYVPIVLNHALDLYGIKSPVWDLHFLCEIACLVFGTLVPFFLLKVTFFKRKKAAISFGLKEFLVDFVVFFFVVSLAIFLSNTLVSRFNIKGNLIGLVGIDLADDKLNNLLGIFSCLFLAPLLEEFAYRGVLLNTLSRYGKRFASLASALIFTIAHYSATEFLGAFMMAIFLNGISLKYRSIKPCVALRIMFMVCFYLVLIAPGYWQAIVYFLLAIVYLLAGYFIIARIYRFIRIRKASSTADTLLYFFCNPAVLLALFLLLFSSYLAYLL